MWQVKCVKDNLKAMLPFQRDLRLLKDSVLGYKRDARKDQATISNGLMLLDLLGDVEGKTVLEIGTGWQPMIPILFSLKGATVYTTDLHPLMREVTFSAALESIRENRDEVAKRLGIAVADVEFAVRPCENGEMANRLAEFRLKYLAPCDCCNLPMDAGSIDIVTSRAVLEHIPGTVIERIFGESHRVLRSGGIALHLIDHSDHWSHRDPSITAVNFLQYPEWMFRLTCFNSQNYQNRLRHSEYRALLERAGFVIRTEDRTVDPRSLAALEKLQIDERFKGFPAEELATVESVLLAEA